MAQLCRDSLVDPWMTAKRATILEGQGASAYLHTAANFSSQLTVLQITSPNPRHAPCHSRRGIDNSVLRLGYVLGDVTGVFERLYLTIHCQRYAARKEMRTAKIPGQTSCFGQPWEKWLGLACLSAQRLRRPKKKQNKPPLNPRLVKFMLQMQGTYLARLL